jgi:hypothetical protein
MCAHMQSTGLSFAIRTRRSVQHATTSNMNKSNMEQHATWNNMQHAACNRSGCTTLSSQFRRCAGTGTRAPPIRHRTLVRTAYCAAWISAAPRKPQFRYARPRQVGANAACCMPYSCMGRSHAECRTFHCCALDASIQICAPILGFMALGLPHHP